LIQEFIVSNDPPTPPTSRVIAASAGLPADVVDLLDLSEADGNEPLPVEFLGRLIKLGRLSEAIGFAAFAMPVGEVIRWAISCAGKATRAKVGLDALKAAEAWLHDPSRENHVSILPAAEAAGFNTAAGCAALATFCGGPSLAPADLEAVPPEPGLAAQAASGAVMLAAAVGDPSGVSDRLLGSLDVARERLARHRSFSWKSVIS
jgi:hypothetical protein